MTWTNVTWIDGPHDGLHQRIVGELPRARVCHCHGALYLAEEAGDGYELVYADRWTNAEQERDREKPDGMTDRINLTQLRRGDTYLGPDGPVMLIQVSTLAALIDAAEAAIALLDVPDHMGNRPIVNPARLRDALARFTTE